MSMSLDFTFSVRNSVAQAHIKDGCGKRRNIFIYIYISEVPVLDSI